VPPMYKCEPPVMKTCPRTCALSVMGLSYHFSQTVGTMSQGVTFA